MTLYGRIGGDVEYLSHISNNIDYHSLATGGFDVQAQYAFGNQSRGFNHGAADDFGRSDRIMIPYHSPVLDARGISDALRDNSIISHTSLDKVMS